MISNLHSLPNEDAVSCCLAVSLSCESLKYAIPTAMFHVFTMSICQRVLTSTAVGDKIKTDQTNKGRDVPAYSQNPIKLSPNLVHIPCRLVDRFNRLLDHATNSEKPLQVRLCHPVVPLPLFRLYSCTHPISHRYVECGVPSQISRLP